MVSISIINLNKSTNLFQQLSNLYINITPYLVVISSYSFSKFQIYNKAKSL